MDIRLDNVSHPAVVDLIALHLEEMHATSPADSVHALGTSGLTAPDVTVWSAWEGDALLGIGALKELSAEHGEIKSMRTAPTHHRKGVGASLLAHLLAEARSRGYQRVSLETGTQSFFAPAHRLYARHGFSDCAPFGDYVPDPNSRYMTLVL
jgi:putative acetyltransferase